MNTLRKSLIGLLASNEWKNYVDEVLKPTNDANNSILGGHDPKEHISVSYKTTIAVKHPLLYIEVLTKNLLKTSDPEFLCEKPEPIFEINKQR